MRRAGTTFTRPRDWRASYQGRYASGGDHFYSTFLLGARARSPNKSNLAITLAYSDHWRMRRLPRAGTHIAVGRGNSRVFVSGRLQDLGFAGTSSPWWEVRRSQPRVRATTGPGEPSWSFPRPPRQGHATAGWIPGRVSVTSLTRRQRQARSFGAYEWKRRSPRTLSCGIHGISLALSRAGYSSSRSDLE